MRKVFLDDLPRWRYGKGQPNGVINWKASVGCKVKFIYDDINGIVEIIDYDGEYLYIKYINNKIFKFKIGSFVKCQFGIMLNKITNDFRYSIGDSITCDSRDLTIIDTFYRNKYKYYRYRCNICKWDNGEISEYNLLKGTGCSCCSGRTTVLGINSLWDTDKWIIPLIGEEMAKTNTKGSCKYITVTCPICGNTKNKKKKIYQIYQTHSIGCDKCGDGISQPEKVMIGVLNQLNIDFETEYSPDWIKPKRYDFYLKKFNVLIEMDGNFHYNNNELSGQSVNVSKKIDKLKDQKAKQHGLEVIRIDCKNSNFEFIKHNIINSKLSELLNFKIVNWCEVEEYSISNFLKKACDIKRENEDFSTTVIGKILGLSNTTISSYLKRGLSIWNDFEYNPKKEKYKGSIKSGKLGTKKVAIFKENKILDIFNSATELSLQGEEIFNVKLSISGISQVCNGKLKQYKGFTFKYVNTEEVCAS